MTDELDRPAQYPRDLDGGPLATARGQHCTENPPPNTASNCLELLRGAAGAWCVRITVDFGTSQALDFFSVAPRGANEMTKRVALYVRVSTDGQTVANQEEELKAVAKRHGWQIVRSFADRGVSGTKSRDGRPGFDELWKATARREFDLVAAWDMSRLGRSLKDLVTYLGDLQAKGVDLYLHRQGIDTSTPSGKFFFHSVAAFVEYERDMIAERVRAGLARARREGRVGGRPRVSPQTEKQIKAALAAGGKGLRKIAADVGVGTSVVQRIKAEAAGLA